MILKKQPIMPIYGTEIFMDWIRKNIDSEKIIRQNWHIFGGSYHNASKIFTFPVLISATLNNKFQIYHWMLQWMDWCNVPLTAMIYISFLHLVNVFLA